jgi:AcrR family transcriptional regulator
VSKSRKSRGERRDQILACARDLFAEKGYHAVTVDDIAARVEVARGTIYLYFADKRAVFEAIVDDFFAHITGSIRSIDLESEAPPLAQLRANMTRLAQLALDEPATMKIVIRDTAGVDPDFDAKIASFYRALRQFLGESLEEGQRIGLVRGGDRDVMTALGIGALKEILLQAVTGEIPRTATELTDEIMRFLERGLVA